MPDEPTSTATLYDRVADLPLRLEDYELSRRERETSSGFTRVTTVVSLHGDGHTGKGEDVTYETADHDRLLESADFDLAGDYTVETFSRVLDSIDLFPGDPPTDDKFRHYRRWAFESPALDLALRQADHTLAEALDRERDPVNFVASTRLGEPPTADRVEAILDRVPDLEFKLDPTPEWSASLIETLADTDSVRILDLKAFYEGTEVDAPPDADRYERLLKAFPEAIVEDPGVTEETRSVLEPATSRLSWDAPIEALSDLDELPWEPRWINVKPSRFGSIESLFETIEACERRGIRLYGGGQFELDVGRGQIQLLASLLYPDGPNDVAPGAFNTPDVPETLPSSPLEPPTTSAGFRW